MHNNSEINILIVDDTMLNIKLLGSLLSHYKYNVEFALNGKAALEWVEKKEFDLILLDVMMPGMSGYEVCVILKNNPKHKDIPVIFITSKIDSDSIVQGFELGAVDYISKPFNENELKVRISTQIELKLSRDKIKSHTKELESANKQITDSIRYAEKIQKALLPPKVSIKSNLKNHFILYKPKDIVSGDFYWIKKCNNNIYLATVDCTGHGVPGAFMSTLGISLLNEIISIECNKMPSEILGLLRKKIKATLHQSNNKMELFDGFDIALCLLEYNNKIVHYAGAFIPMYIYRDSTLIETKADRQPVSTYFKENDFTNHTIKLKDGDMIYLFTDGYSDQLGGANIKKFSRKSLKSLFLKICNLPVKEQCKMLKKEFNKWKGDNDQTDDILIIGLKI